MAVTVEKKSTLSSDTEEAANPEEEEEAHGVDKVKEANLWLNSSFKSSSSSSPSGSPWYERPRMFSGSGAQLSRNEGGGWVGSPLSGWSTRSMLLVEVTPPEDNLMVN